MHEFRFVVSHNPCNLKLEDLKRILGPDTRATHPRNSIHAIIVTPGLTEKEVLLKLARVGSMIIIEAVK